MVQAERRLTVEWRFISLRLINSHVDYDTYFPPGYEAQHTAGLRLLRVAARSRAEHGPDAVDALQQALGSRIFDTPRPAGDDGSEERFGRRAFVEPVLREAGLPAGLAGALDDESWDAQIRSEGDEALGLTGKDVGTPIIQVGPPDPVAFFGPVISRLPSVESAGELWDHVLALARFPGFAELKRSLREQPQLAALGADPDEVGALEDWRNGSRR